MPVLGRIVRAGFVAALLVAVGGWTLERVRFGATDASAAEHVRADVQQLFDATADALGAIAAKAAPDRDLIRTAPRDTSAARQLFAIVDAALPADSLNRTGVTIYDETDAPVAWAGHVSDFPKERLRGPAAIFVATSGLGPRLVRIQPITDTEPRRPPVRTATVVVEQALAPADEVPEIAGRFVLPTSRAPVILGAPVAGRADSPFAFTVTSRDGTPLASAEVSALALAAARAHWRQQVGAAVLSVIALALLLYAGPLVERRRLARTASRVVTATVGLVIALALSRAAFWLASMPLDDAPSLLGPINLLLTALFIAPMTWLVVDSLERRRLMRPSATLLTSAPYPGLRAVSLYLVTGAFSALALWQYERLLRLIVFRTNVDLLHFSLHPLDTNRLALAFGLVLLHASAIWITASLARLPTLVWRVPRGRLVWLARAAWSAGALATVIAISGSPAATPALSLIVALTATAACAMALSRLRRRARHMSQALRLAALFIALLAPSLAMYPSMLAFAIQAKERLIADEYGPDALNVRDDLQKRVNRARDQIDALPALADYVTTTSDAETPATDRGFFVWSQTDLGTYRQTSAVELYRRDGRLVSRFALYLPGYGTEPYVPQSCSWVISDDISPIGASEPHVLRASRGICVRGRIVGGVIIRAMVDYRTLPFIAPQSPVLESLRPNRRALGEDVPGRDVEFVVYGWSRAPIDARGPSVWTLPDSVFARTSASRERFWDTLERDGERFRVYFLSDRGGIYALGYPIITPFGHLINLAELVMLAFALYVLLVGGATMFGTLTTRALSGRALLREVRASFYRKLFLAFWAVAVLPVVILAVAIRTYFATELEAGVVDGAAKTATVAQRLVEDYATLQQRGGALDVLDDGIMLLVSRAIDEDVNLFDREAGDARPSRLQATSERDLFASQFLSTRTPGDVYQRVYLDRAPVYVSEQAAGPVGYLVAAAPVRSGGREGIVTVPVTLRQREIEQQIDELDRRVLFGAVLFSLLGGAAGYWMAEQLADPINRLTRATRRIARGDFDARIAAASADELGRLLGDFNRMAADLKRQRVELERTQRLEAWADMARQVAHDIKNPLTPIQLSAEHAQRVNRDRGGPLSPVLDECVNAILGQVRLLRQIASEFSSFASSPTPRPEPTDVVALVDEVVAPYRAGLNERIAIAVDATEPPASITIDRTLFARALTNIIENALHAMPGTGRLTIAIHRSLSTGSQRPSLVVQVTDTGVGMEPDALARIFEPYFSTKATGTGLGLTIAKRNAELNGGTIQVTSERGVGTTVTIELPL